MSENFSAETEYNRRKLYPLFRTAKKMPAYENNVFMVEDVLFVKNTRYTVDTLDQLPGDLQEVK